ncbi:hypothetical protein E4T56_gene179 [Termitomyces sp. T112]|nr:hypothetical protein E4T56_gene179 [Termitomyces sp. T112]
MGCIVPAILSDPLIADSVNLVADENAAPAMTRIDEDAKEYREECMSWSRQYFKALFHEAAGYEHAIKAGKDVRHFWFALRDW